MTTTIKTQINSLQRGHGNIGIIGRNHELRNEIAWKVKWENPETLRVAYKGREYALHYSQSQSGKSFWYTSEELPLEIIREVVPFDGKLREPENICMYMSIDGNMYAEWIVYHRTTPRAQWKCKFQIEIPERDITIL